MLKYRRVCISLLTSYESVWHHSGAKTSSNQMMIDARTLQPDPERWTDVPVEFVTSSRAFGVL